MTKDEALDLALAALQFKNILNACGQYSVVDPVKAAEAITAIKQARALDKKAENARELGLDYEPAQKQRWAVFCRFCNKEWSVSYKHPGKSVCVDCDDAPPAQPAPVQEPVAWAHKEGLEKINDFDASIYARGGFDDAVPLYTTPPAAQRQWVGLREAVEAEREALLDLVDDYAKNNTDLKAAIRNRGNT
jgi:hypothetical protein